MFATLLVERSLPAPEICGSNLVIGKFGKTTVNCTEKTKIMKINQEWPKLMKNKVGKKDKALLG